MMRANDRNRLFIQVLGGGWAEFYQDQESSSFTPRYLPSQRPLRPCGLVSYDNSRPEDRKGAETAGAPRWWSLDKSY